MDIEYFRDFCLSFPETHEAMPFNGFFRNAHAILVMYYREKMFCLFDIDKFDACTIKCASDKIDELKARYHAVDKPYNLSSKYWISVRFNADIPSDVLKKLVKDSYDLVSQKYKKT